MRDLEMSAASLYDGGWRAEDKEELISEYHLTEQEADELVEKLAEYEDRKQFETAVALMDDEIREDLHREMAPCTDAEFLAAYKERHAEKYGEEFSWI